MHRPLPLTRQQLRAASGVGSDGMTAIDCLNRLRWDPAVRGASGDVIVGVLLRRRPESGPATCRSLFRPHHTCDYGDACKYEHTINKLDEPGDLLEHERASALAVGNTIVRDVGLSDFRRLHAAGQLQPYVMCYAAVSGRRVWSAFGEELSLWQAGVAGDAEAGTSVGPAEEPRVPARPPRDTSALAFLPGTALFRIGSLLDDGSLASLLQTSRSIHDAVAVDDEATSQFWIPRASSTAALRAAAQGNAVTASFLGAAAAGSATPAPAAAGATRLRDSHALAAHTTAAGDCAPGGALAPVAAPRVKDVYWRLQRSASWAAALRFSREADALLKAGITIPTQASLPVAEAGPAAAADGVAAGSVPVPAAQNPAAPSPAPSRSTPTATTTSSARAPPSLASPPTSPQLGPARRLLPRLPRGMTPEEVSVSASLHRATHLQRRGSSSDDDGGAAQQPGPGGRRRQRQRRASGAAADAPELWHDAAPTAAAAAPNRRVRRAQLPADVPAGDLSSVSSGLTEDSASDREGGSAVGAVPGARGRRSSGPRLGPDRRKANASAGVGGKPSAAIHVTPCVTAAAGAEGLTRLFRHLAPLPAAAGLCADSAEAASHGPHPDSTGSSPAPASASMAPSPAEAVSRLVAAYRLKQAIRRREDAATALFKHALCAEPSSAGGGRAVVYEPRGAAAPALGLPRGLAAAAPGLVPPEASSVLAVAEAAKVLSLPLSVCGSGRPTGASPAPPSDATEAAAESMLSATAAVAAEAVGSAPDAPSSASDSPPSTVVASEDLCVSELLPLHASLHIAAACSTAGYRHPLRRPTTATIAVAAGAVDAAVGTGTTSKAPEGRHRDTPAAAPAARVPPSKLHRGAPAFPSGLGTVRGGAVFAAAESALVGPVTAVAVDPTTGNVAALDRTGTLRVHTLDGVCVGAGRVVAEGGVSGAVALSTAAGISGIESGDVRCCNSGACSMDMFDGVVATGHSDASVVLTRLGASKAMRAIARVHCDPLSLLTRDPVAGEAAAGVRLRPRKPAAAAPAIHTAVVFTDHGVNVFVARRIARRWGAFDDGGGSVALISAETGECIRSLVCGKASDGGSGYGSIPSLPASVCAASPSMVWVGYSDGALRLWDTRDFRHNASLTLLPASARPGEEGDAASALVQRIACQEQGAGFLLAECRASPQLHAAHEVPFAPLHDRYVRVWDSRAASGVSRRPASASAARAAPAGPAPAAASTSAAAGGGGRGLLREIDLGSCTRAVTGLLLTADSLMLSHQHVLLCTAPTRRSGWERDGVDAPGGAARAAAAGPHHDRLWSCLLQSDLYLPYIPAYAWPTTTVRSRLIDHAPPAGVLHTLSHGPLIQLRPAAAAPAIVEAAHTALVPLAGAGGAAEALEEEDDGPLLRVPAEMSGLSVWSTTTLTMTGYVPLPSTTCLAGRFHTPHGGTAVEDRPATLSLAGVGAAPAPRQRSTFVLAAGTGRGAVVWRTDAAWNQ